MNTLGLLHQMLILLAMMAVGYGAFRLKFFNEEGQHQFSTVIVKISNPLLLISSALGEKNEKIYEMAGQDLFLAVLYYAVLIVISLLFALVLRKRPKQDLKMQQCMLIFSNVIFLSIPIIRGLLGEEYVIFLVFYIMLTNILLYTYGVFLASGMSEGAAKFEPKKILNTGTISCVIALIVFALDVQVPVQVRSFLSYMGNLCIPIPMMLIGASLAKLTLRKVFLNRNSYLFCAFKLLVVPGIAILLFRNLPVAPELLQIFFLMFSMPIATIVGMLSEEYAGRGNDANQIIALTTVLSVVTIPLLSLFY